MEVIFWEIFCKRIVKEYPTPRHFMKPDSICIISPISFPLCNQFMKWNLKLLRRLWMQRLDAQAHKLVYQKKKKSKKSWQIDIKSLVFLNGKIRKYFAIRCMYIWYLYIIILLSRLSFNLESISYHKNGNDYNVAKDFHLLSDYVT